MDIEIVTQIMRENRALISELIYDSVAERIKHEASNMSPYQ